jgi:hypothetical protein
VPAADYKLAQLRAARDTASQDLKDHDKACAPCRARARRPKLDRCADGTRLLHAYWAAERALDIHREQARQPAAGQDTLDGMGLLDLGPAGGAAQTRSR